MNFDTPPKKETFELFEESEATRIVETYHQRFWPPGRKRGDKLVSDIAREIIIKEGKISDNKAIDRLSLIITGKVLSREKDPYPKNRTEKPRGHGEAIKRWEELHDK